MGHVATTLAKRTMKKKLLCKKNQDLLLPVLEYFTCIDCHLPYSKEASSPDGSRHYTYTCQCGAEYNFRFYRRSWSWSMIRFFSALREDCEWGTVYYLEENKTLFFVVGDEVPSEEEHYFDGYVTHDTFIKLIPFI